MPLYPWSGETPLLPLSGEVSCHYIWGVPARASEAGFEGREYQDADRRRRVLSMGGSMCVCLCVCVCVCVFVCVCTYIRYRYRYRYRYRQKRRTQAQIRISMCVCIPTDTNKRASAFTAPATEQLSERSAAAASLFHMRLQSLDCMDGMVWSRARPKDTIPESDRTVSSCLDCMHATVRPDSGQLRLPRRAGTACF